MDWFKRHWQPIAIGVVAFIVGVAIGGSGGDAELSDELAEARQELAQAEGERDATQRLADRALAEREDTVRESAEVVEEVRAASRARRASAETAAAPEPEPEPELNEVPNVVGLPLPAAKQLLKQAGYRAAATNTDTTLGIIVESNYTICSQDEPRGNLVPVLAQKYGC